MLGDVSFEKQERRYLAVVDVVGSLYRVMLMRCRPRRVLKPLYQTEERARSRRLAAQSEVSRSGPVQLAARFAYHWQRLDGGEVFREVCPRECSRANEGGRRQYRDVCGGQ